MKFTRLLVCAGMVAGAAACGGDTPSAPRTPGRTSPVVILPAESECQFASLDLSPTSATIDATDTKTFSASIWGVASNGDTCVPSDVAVTWTTADPAEIRGTSGNSATVGAKLVNGGTAGGTATVYAKGVQNALGGGTRTHIGSASITIRPRTPAPILSAISGPTTIPVVGNYSFSVSATGGNGTSYTYYWDRSTDGGATWSNILTQSAGGSTTASINIQQQVTKIRVRAVSGNSAEATSGVFSVDGTGALDLTINRPMKITAVGGYSWEAMPSGGSGTYTYRWDDGQTSKIYTKWIDGCWPDPGVTVTVTVTSGAYSITRSASTPVLLPPNSCTGG